jgi:sec-independent protein translocase protein TatC
VTGANPSARAPRAARANREKRMSLAAHLRELRKRLFISAIAILAAAILAFAPWPGLSALIQAWLGWTDVSSIAELVIAAMRQPITEIAEQRNADLTYTTITSAFDLRMLISFTIAVVVASPVWLYQIFAFFVPGLTRREKQYTFGFFLSAVPLFLAGMAVGWLVFPHMVTLLTSFSSDQDATLLEARAYYDFVVKLMLAVGVAFVLPVFLVILNLMGIVSAASIIKSWRIAILVIVLFTALATPAADVISMFLLAIPMIALYFAAWLIAFLHDRRAERRRADLEAEYEL